MDLDLQTHINSRCCSEPLNVFTFQEGTVPTIEDFETMIGFTINGAKINGNSIEFSNKNYTLEESKFETNYNLVSLKSQAKILENGAFVECENLLSAEFPLLTDVVSSISTFYTVVFDVISILSDFGFEFLSPLENL